MSEAEGRELSIRTAKYWANEIAKLEAEILEEHINIDEFIRGVIARGGFTMLDREVLAVKQVRINYKYSAIDELKKKLTIAVLEIPDVVAAINERIKPKEGK